MEDYTVLAPDKSRPRKFLYKKNEKPMIVYCDNSDYKEFYGKGWYDTPAAFFDMGRHGVPKEKMPGLHKEMDSIKDLVNDEINLDAMDAPALKAYADKNMPGLEYHKTAKAEFMLKLIKDERAKADKEEEEFLNDEPVKGDDNSFAYDRASILDGGGEAS